MLFLRGAGRAAKICGRAAYIVDITFPQGMAGHSFHFSDDGIVGTSGDHFALMECQCAKVTAAETATVMDDAKPHLINGRDTAKGIIAGVDFPCIGQLGDFV